MPRSVVPVVLDNRVQHLGRTYVNSIRAAHRLPLSTSESIFPNHYTSVCATLETPHPKHFPQPAKPDKDCKNGEEIGLKEC